MIPPRARALPATRFLIEAGLLLVLPLAFYRGFAGQFITTQSLLAQSMVAAALATWALGVGLGETAVPGGHRLAQPLALLSGVVLLSCLASSVPRFSLESSVPFLCGPAWLFTLLSWARGEAAARRIAILVTLAGSMVALIAVIQRLGYDPLLFGGYHVEWGNMPDRMRAYSTLGNPDFVSGYLIGAIFLAAGLGMTAKRWPVRGLAFLAVGMMLAAVAAAGSMGGWMGLTVGGAAAWLAARYCNCPGKTSLLLRFNPQEIPRHSGSAQLFWAPVALWPIVDGFQSVRRKIGGRLYLWRIGLRGFPSHPLLGSGWATFQLRFPDLQARFLEGHPNWVRFWTNTSQAHNDLLQMMIETGLLGVMALGWLAWGWAKEFQAAARSLQDWASAVWLATGMGALAAMGTDSFFNSQIAVPPTLILIFTLLAFPSLLTSVEATAGAAVPASVPSAIRRLLALAALLLSAILAFVTVTHVRAEREYASAMALEAEGDVPGAEIMARRGLAEDPLNGPLHFSLARLSFFQGQYAEALEQANLAERTYRDSHLDVLRARVLDAMGRTPDALDAFRFALREDPTLKTVQGDIQRLQAKMPNSNAPSH